ncbi:MAG: hypothetical protein QXM16_00915 [Nitrososphaerota archaeon]
MPQSELTIPLAGALAGLVYGLVGLGWGGVVFRTLLLTGVAPRQALSTALLSDVILNVGGKLYPVGKTEEKGSAKDATFSGLTLLTTLLVSAATIGYIETPYEKHLGAALNLLLAFLHATQWNGGKGGVSVLSHSSSCVALGRSGWRLNLYPRLIQRSRPLQLLTILPRILILELLLPLHEENVLHALLLSAPALPTLWIARRVREWIGEEVLGWLAVIAFALKGLTSLIT